ncbi:MAG: DNA alkylation repair protein, partial [Chloroflexota bacterium]
MKINQVLAKLKSLGNAENAAGMARFGININQAFGVRMPDIRKLGKEVGVDHSLALALWDTGIHEARILASTVDDPQQVTVEQMDSWIVDFNSWDLCDQVCGNLFDKTPYAYAKAVEWTGREAEYEKRAGFAMMAWLAVHDKKA